MGVVRMYVWLVGVVVMRYLIIIIDILITITFHYSTCIYCLSYGTRMLISLFIFKMFFLSCLLLLNHNYYK